MEFVLVCILRIVFGVILGGIIGFCMGIETVNKYLEDNDEYGGE